MSYYIIDPYSRFAGKKKQRHWMDIAEEEAQFFKYLMEQQRVQQQATAEAVITAGGVPEPGFFTPRSNVVSFTIAPYATGSAPYTAYFNNTSHSDLIRYADWTWNFSDGTSAKGPTAVKLFQTGSFSVSVTASNTFNGNQYYSSVSRITSSLPFIIADYTSSIRSGSVPLNVTFRNTSFIPGYTGSLSNITWKWQFGSGSLTSSEFNPPPVTYYQTGSYNVKLEATASYGITSVDYLLFISASL